MLKAPRSALALLFSFVVMMWGLGAADVSAQTPAAPSGVNGSVSLLDATFHSYLIRWTDNSNNEAGFHIFASYTPSNWSLVGTAAANDTGAIVDLNPQGQGTVLYFMVMSYTGTSQSPTYSAFSNIISVTTPAAYFFEPTSLIGSLVGEHTIALSWNDNSTTEWYFEIEWKLSTDASFVSLGTVIFNTTQISLPNNTPNKTHQFRVRAVRGNSPYTAVTTYSNTVSVAIPNMPAPTNLQATVTGELGVNLTWNDNSTNEGGYLIYARIQGSGAQFSNVAVANINATSFSLNGNHLPYPGTAYEIQVVAGFQNGAELITSNPSNTVTPSLPFNAATNLQLTAIGETSATVTWTDNSQVESGYDVLARRVGDTQWLLFGSAAANSTNFSGTGLSPSTNWEFSTQAIYTLAVNDEVGSAISNIVSGTTTFNAPSNLNLVASTETTVSLNWTDNSVTEHFFELLMRPAGSSDPPESFGFLNPNQTSTTVPGLDPGTSYEFFVRAGFEHSSTNVSYTANSNGLTVTTKDAVNSALYVEAVKGVPFNYQLTVTNNAAHDSWNIANLPAGLGFNSGDGTITGTPTAGGVTQCPVVVQFTSGSTHNNTLVIRVLQPPAIGAVIGNQTLGTGATLDIPLAGKFTDPDATTAVRITTNMAVNAGVIDLVFFDASAPLTVANFLTHVNAGDYDNSVYHRSETDFVVQGGSFRASTPPDNFTEVPEGDSVQNEPNLSNVRGTLALAKQDGLPNSGTVGYFFNLQNNGPNLDFQNGGFSPFARATASGMAVVDAIGALPRGDYDVYIDSSPASFGNWPINDATAPATMDNTKVVNVNSMTQIPVLALSVHSNTNPAAVTASIVSNQVHLVAVGTGSTTVTLRATDLDGNVTDQVFDVTVAKTFTEWATESSLPPGQDGPNGNPDFDSLTNLGEFGFMGNPLLADDALVLPVPVAPEGGSPVARITFNVRKNAHLIYLVQVSPNMEGGGWSTIWSSSVNGLGAANVVANLDMGTYNRITVADSVVLTAGIQRFLHVVIQEGQ